jgi:hypothetical protein
MVFWRREIAQVGELPKRPEIAAYRPRLKCSFPPISAAGEGVQVGEDMKQLVALLPWPGQELRFERMTPPPFNCMHLHMWSRTIRSSGTLYIFV